MFTWRAPDIPLWLMGSRGNKENSSWCNMTMIAVKRIKYEYVSKADFRRELWCKVGSDWTVHKEGQVSPEMVTRPWKLLPRLPTAKCKEVSVQRALPSIVENSHNFTREGKKENPRYKIFHTWLPFGFFCHAKPWTMEVFFSGRPENENLDGESMGHVWLRHDLPFMD